MQSWPFAQDSIWNLPIHNDAIYKDANMAPPIGDVVRADKDVIIGFNDANPLTDIYRMSDQTAATVGITSAGASSITVDGGGTYSILQNDTLVVNVGGTDYTYTVTADSTASASGLSNTVSITPNVVVEIPDDTSIKNITAFADGRDELFVGTPILYSRRIPSSYEYYDPTANNCGTLFDDDTNFIQMQPLQYIDSTLPPEDPAASDKWTCAQTQWEAQSLYADGIVGAHAGSGMSAIGGTIRVDELKEGSVIRHALKVNIDTNLYAYYDVGEADGKPGYRWPAVSSDSGANDPANFNFYGGSNTDVQMGSLLALLPTFNVEILTTTPAKIIAQALKDYGAYIVDNAGSQNFAFMPEESPNGSVIQQVFDDYNIVFDTVRNNPTLTPETFEWISDIKVIVNALNVITNNDETTIGGGANTDLTNRRALPAPDFFADFLWTPARLSTLPVVWFCSTDSSTVKGTSNRKVKESGDFINRWNYRRFNPTYGDYPDVYCSGTSGLPTYDSIGSQIALDFPAAKLNFNANISGIKSGFFVTDDAEPNFAQPIIGGLFDQDGVFINCDVGDAYDISLEGANSNTGNASANGQITLSSGGNIDLGLSAVDKTGLNLWYFDVDTAITINKLCRIERTLFSANYNGKLGELILLDYIPTQEYRQLIEGYLSWKYSGLVAKLPATHPYKTVGSLFGL